QRLAHARRDAVPTRLQIVLERLAVALELRAEVVDLLAEAGAVALALFGTLLVVALDLRERVGARARSADVFVELAHGRRLRDRALRALRGRREISLGGGSELRDTIGVRPAG